MAQAMSEIWTTEGLNPALPRDAGSAVPKQQQRLPERAAQFLSSRVESIASGNPSAMPPIVQFAMHAVAWCRAKVKGGVNVESPLRLVSQLQLGGKRSLSLVEANGLRFLIGGGAESVTVIVPVSRAASVNRQDKADICGCDSEEARAL